MFFFDLSYYVRYRENSCMRENIYFSKETISITNLNSIHEHLIIKQSLVSYV
jgi:hypothetical protein